jgi:hypothetical protein
MMLVYSVALAHMRLDKFNKANDSVAITRKRLSDLSSSQGDHSTGSGLQIIYLVRVCVLLARDCCSCSHIVCFINHPASVFDQAPALAAMVPVPLARTASRIAPTMPHRLNPASRGLQQVGTCTKGRNAALHLA